MIRQPPETASIALPGDGAKLCAPSAQRNRDPLCALLAQVAPDRGRALELASGTGQHVVAFAAQLPGLHWCPSDPDPTRRASIDAYRADAALGNLAPAIELNAAQPGWGQHHGNQNLIVLCNLLHLISTPEAQLTIAEAADALVPGGRFVIYGPFMRAGELTSPGDAKFHASLTAHDPQIGYKDDFDVLDWAETSGLVPFRVVEMPANNLAIVLEKPTG
ncbi:DUF938 domain-containing protein [Rhodobacteraceae bacterium F11138]|nr:DUF938 domain-containing protein [Rhodobacteraceae bacterium F11138]